MRDAAPRRMLRAYRSSTVSAPSFVAEGLAMRRRSFVLPLACLLAVATSLTLLRLDSLMARSEEPGIPAIDAGPNAALVRDFYDAADATLRSGDPGALASLLAPGFVEHDG